MVVAHIHLIAAQVVTPALIAGLALLAWGAISPQGGNVHHSELSAPR
ncbi:MAG TPA: hypothetical protein VIN40_07650 [Candidatus Tyrphobacter sp.]